MSRRTIMLCAALWVSVVVLSAAFAVDPKPVAAPYVKVTRSDGSIVAGQLVESDPRFVTVRTAATSDGKSNPVKIPWSSIKSVSNGLTQPAAARAWKALHVKELCPTCHGDGTAVCSTCKGTGHNPESSKVCNTCKGTMSTPCKTARCDHGKLPCPATCLKLTEGTWYKRPDGSRWRKFPTKNGGYYEWSEHHVGELIKKTGDTWVTLGPCPTCNGKSKIDDPACSGSGFIPCVTCIGDKAAPKCQKCGGAARLLCETCAGSGIQKRRMDDGGE